jgi:hypothetical protein
MIPFVVENSERVILRNFSVDWQRPFYSQGEVEIADRDGVVVRIDADAYPYRVENGGLVFEGEGWESPLTEGVFAFDPATRAPTFRSGDSMGLGFPERIRAEKVASGAVRLREEFPRLPEPGTLIVFRHYNRHTPGVFSLFSGNVLCESITLHQAGGMGFIAQFCENVELRGCTVTPSSGRIFSVCADATHFVNCRGGILLRDCLFENQLDDPLNVHGLNTRLKEIVDRYSVVTERVHHEQHGVAVGMAGDTVLFSDDRTLLGYHENLIDSVDSINARYARVRFRHALPEKTRPGHVIENTSWIPDLHVTGCAVRNNRARGFLVSVAGKVRIEGNRISAPGAGIKISGDAKFWFESGAVRDVEIRDNDFGECCYGDPPWGYSVIDIDPEIAEPEKNEACFHRNIRIEGNRFATSGKRFLFARSVEGLRFAGNSIRQTGFYPPVSDDGPAISLEACESVAIEGNDGLDFGENAETSASSARETA